ncbi:MAG: IS110 family transposase, partial [Terriglobia bacterium]
MTLSPDPSNRPSPKARKRLQAAKIEEVKKRQAAPKKKPKKRSLKSKARRSLPVDAPSLPAELKQVNVNAAGIDVGATTHFVCVPQGRDPQPVRTFGAFTADLEAIADWLAKCGVTAVAMEATGVFWIPLFELLERRGFEVKLVNPSRLKHVPGRKSDVLDCQWIQQLHTFGLLSGSFRPEDSICVLRSFMRQRQTLVRSAARCVQHMQKALTQMNLKLQHVLSDIAGVTGMAILNAILAGERNPVTLAALRHQNCKNDEATIALALQGNWREDHLFALQQAMNRYHFYHQQLAEVDKKIESQLKTFKDKSQGKPLEHRASKGKRTANSPAFDVRQYVYTMTGMDLTTVDGLDANTILIVISEIGLDMSRWPTEKHFASWLSLSPGVNKTGGRTQSTNGRTRPSSNRAAAALRMAAYTLLRAECALGAYARRMRARLGSPKAITATAHKLAIIIYNMLKHGKAYVDRGVEYYEQQYRAAMLKNLQRRAKQLGFQLVEA